VDRCIKIKSQSNLDNNCQLHADCIYSLLSNHIAAHRVFLQCVITNQKGNEREKTALLFAVNIKSSGTFLLHIPLWSNNRQKIHGLHLDRIQIIKLHLITPSNNQAAIVRLMKGLMTSTLTAVLNESVQ